jgi:hypothetical protein
MSCTAHVLPPRLPLVYTAIRYGVPGTLWHCQTVAEPTVALPHSLAGCAAYRAPKAGTCCDRVSQDCGLESPQSFTLQQWALALIWQPALVKLTITRAGNPPVNRYL